MVIAWSLHGHCMVVAWSLHGHCMIIAWSLYGHCMVYIMMQSEKLTTVVDTELNGCMDAVFASLQHHPFAKHIHEQNKDCIYTRFGNS